MENFEKLKTFIMSLEDDADKFFNKGNNAASVRLTKGMQTIKAMAQEVRKSVFDKKQAK